MGTGISARFAGYVGTKRRLAVVSADGAQPFSVWAPEARRVELLVDGRAVPFTRGARGWWSVDVDGAGPGTDYQLSVDGSDGLPDPRSAWQPSGVHGPSRVVDHERFRWTDRHWRGIDLSSSVLYELHVGTFTDAGTFDAAIAHLDHLVGLGATAVELLPVAEFSGERGWGYDGVDLYAPHHAYGGPDGLRRLVDACHGRGLGVLLDVVYNHLGPEGNYLGRFGPYIADQHTTPWGPGIDLDGSSSAEVAEFFVGNALMWLRDYHVDGLRLDAVHALADGAALSFLQRLSRRVEELAGELGRQLVLVAESDRNDPRIVQARHAGGRGSTDAGATSSIMPCTPCSPASATATTATSDPSSRSPRPFDSPTSTTGRGRPTAAASTAGRCRPGSRAIASWCAPRATIRSATVRRASARRR